MKTNYKFYKDLKIMVVDDDDRLREQAIGVLVELGFDRSSIYGAIHGLDALAQLKAGKKVELFVIDLVMPEMNGIELMKALGGTPEYAETPKLVLSSESDSNIILNAVAAGANSYLNKPCEKFLMAKKMLECVSK